MGIMDEVKAETRHRGGKCSVLLWLATIAPADLAEWATVFASSAPHTAIHRVMIARGFDGCRSAVERHRAGGCRCGR